MTRIAPPLLGYNNNVRYLGRTFHIQTEDSGTKYARIMTHLFIDGGHIVKSTRTEYGSVVGLPEMAETVRRMMKDQHKNMFLSLRAGEFDQIIERIISGGAPSSVAEPALSHVPRLRTDSLPSLTLGAGEEAKTSPELPPIVIEARQPSEHLALSQPNVADLDANYPRDEVNGSAPPTKHFSYRPRKSSAPGRGRLVDDPTPVDLPETTALNQQSRPSERPSVIVAVRPPTLPVETIDPRSQSIFGDAAAGRQTLDEVILSFLEDEDP